jgi:hypothetical protein
MFLLSAQIQHHRSLFTKWLQGSDKEKKKENAERDVRAKKVCITCIFVFEKISYMPLKI